MQLLLDITKVPDNEIMTELNLPEQEIIKVDSSRTRDGILTQEEKEKLELMLTYFCKDYKISYKQGLNEHCAPFILMTRENLSLSTAYLLFKKFISMNLSSMFSDNVRLIQDFRPLQACFLIFRLVLRYHEPRLSAFFQMNRIIPELFSSSWFLTAFAFKLENIEVLYEL